MTEVTPDAPTDVAEALAPLTDSAAPQAEGAPTTAVVEDNVPAADPVAEAAAPFATDAADPIEEIAAVADAVPDGAAGEPVAAAADDFGAVAPTAPDEVPVAAAADDFGAVAPTAPDEVPVAAAADDFGAVAPTAPDEVPVAAAADDFGAVAPTAPDEVPVAAAADDFGAVAPTAPDEVPEAAPAVPADAEPAAAEVTPPEPVRRPPREVIAKTPGDIGDLDPDQSDADFAAAIERTVVEFKEGDIVEGVVVRVDPDEALIDIGYKTEGVVPAKELSIRNDVNPSEVVSVGERIEALVLQKEDQDGRLILSKKRAQYERAWGNVERVMHDGGTVTGHVIEVVKGGLIVDIGLRGFLPASLVELRRVRDLQPYVGQELEAKVIELDKNRNNVVLSRRAFLEEAQAEQRQEFLDGLKSGEVRTGVVSSVVNFGAFVDLGGMDGLVHVSELSWEHVSHPSEVVTVGDEVQVRVLEVDLDRERISLSVRQTREDPWEEFAKNNSIGTVVDGKVTKTVPFGAFVSVTDGVEGLVHVSEIAAHHVESPEMELSVGQPVKVKITEVDEDRRRISLSIKQAQPDYQERPAFSEARKPARRPERREFEREEEPREPAFNADASLEAILEELKEKGIGRK